MRLCRPFRLLVVLAVLIVGAALPAADLVTNGSFETHPGAGALPQGWTNQASGVTPTVGVSSLTAQAGTWSVRVTGRGFETDGLRQNITSVLGLGGSGVRRWCRAYVRVDDFASVRVLLRLTDSTGQLPDMLLAEQIVRTPDQWVAVEGGSVIAWTGALVNASLRIEVQQLSRAVTKPAGELPGYYLDGLTLDDDLDGDSILDREEATAGFNSALADTDGDGLPDRWELDHGFSAAANEAEADADGDGFTNRQEFWAATDPRDANSYPGKPANPNANAATRSVLRYLALLPSQAPGRHLAAGQHVSDLSTDLTEYPRMIDGLATATGSYPAIVSMAIEPPFDRFGLALQIDAAESRALAYWQAGGLVMMKWAVYNPWSGLNAGDQTTVNIPALIDPTVSAPAALAQNQAAHDRLQTWMTQVGDAFERLQQQGVVVMFRPVSEMNGGWFWWGHRNYQDYAALWDYFYDYFTNTRGLNNLIWVYESASTEHAPSFVGAGASASDYYYPGDDRVDAMCHNLYSATWVLPWDGNGIHSRYPKIYGIPQAGPDHANRTGSFDNLTYINRTEAGLPRSSFFIVWNSFNGTNPVTQVASYQDIGIVDNVNATALMTHAGIATRETLPAPVITTPPLATSVAALSSVTLGVVAEGWSDLHYQWRKAGMDISGEVAPTYTIAHPTTADAGSYDVVVTNANGSVIAAAATLSVSLLPQMINFAAPAYVSLDAGSLPLTATASSGLPVNFQVFSGPATLVGNTLTLTGSGQVILRAGQGGDAIYSAAPAVEVSVEIVSSGFALWQQLKFSAEEIADPNISGPQAVIGLDGLPNLLKYALGFEPKQDVTTGLPEISTAEEDWVYTYSRPAGVTDVGCEVEVSIDLVNWTTMDVVHELVSSEGGIETWRGRYPVALAANVYFRLKVTQL